MPGLPPPLYSVVPYLREELKNATPELRRALTGECLYPLVEMHEPLLAPKITGMLLELDQSEIFHLMESPEDLKSKINEAIKVLSECIPQQNQLQGQEEASAVRKASMPLSKM